MATKANNEFTKTEIIKLAQADPKLAEAVYHDQHASHAQQAYAKFQQNLKAVPQNGHTKMYDYVYFEDLKQTINNAMKGTGLAWHQYAHKGNVVTIPQLDNHGRPSFQLDYTKTHPVTSGWGKYKQTKNVFNPLVNQAGQATPIMTKGQEVSVTTVITYKNGEKLAHGEMSAVAQSTSPQDIGSALTYCRRYSLSIATGASSSKDNDGQQASSVSHVAPTTNYPHSSNNATVPQTISAGQAQMLKNLSNQVAKQYKQPAVKITGYLARMYGNGSSLSSIRSNNFATAKNYLESHLSK